MTTRAKLRYIAIAISLAYTVVRFIFVQVSLAGYGVNPWVFLVVDTITGVVYVLCIEQLILTFRTRQKGVWWRPVLWSGFTAMAFALPYLYIFMFSNELPLSFAIGLGVIVLALLVNAIISIARRVRSGTTR